MGFFDLFRISSIPVVKVLLLTALGSYLALDCVNILGDDARKHLNNITFFVFSPALVYSNLAKTITYDSMVKLWFMPVNILITFIIGSILGWVIIHVTKAPPHLRGLIVGCCAAGNMGNLPLIIIPGVCKERGSPFGDPEICHTLGMAYASLSMAIGAIYLWSYVYNIVRIYSGMNSKGEEISDSPAVVSSRESLLSPSNSWTDSLIASEDHESQLSPSEVAFQNKKHTVVWFLDSTRRHIVILIRNLNLKRLFAPSTTAAIAGFIVGLVPQIRHLTINDPAPLRVLQDTALLLGDGAIPSVSLIMGANLLKGLRGSGIQKSIVFGIMLVRCIALPILGVAILRAIRSFGFIPHDNPLYHFVLLMQFAVPPAMNIGTIMQLFGAGESECSLIMLWCYSFASVALTLWSTFFLWLVSQV